jgi:hypothetical protein
MIQIRDFHTPSTDSMDDVNMFIKTHATRSVTISPRMCYDEQDTVYVVYDEVP